MMLSLTCGEIGRLLLRSKRGGGRKLLNTETESRFGETIGVIHIYVFLGPEVSDCQISWSRWWGQFMPHIRVSARNRGFKPRKVNANIFYLLKYSTDAYFGFA